MPDWPEATCVPGMYPSIIIEKRKFSHFKCPARKLRINFSIHSDIENCMHSVKKINDVSINEILYVRIMDKICFILITVSSLISFCEAHSNDFPSLNKIIPNISESIQEQAAKDVICRTIPKECHLFNVSVHKSLLHKGKDAFSMYKKEDKVHITGSSGVACTWGFHYYLKNYCNCHIGWQTKQLKMPAILSDVNITIFASDRLRFYQNACTTSYSFVWWDINKWREHIDWMALNGINIALAAHGEEAIWERVYRKLNLTEKEIQDHFTGPAFLSWQRMGNIKGWAGPLSDLWHLHTLKLEHFVIEAMTNLSIIPVLPAFAGHVPRAFKRVFPNASLSGKYGWNGFDKKFSPLFLDPVDPLFQYVGRLFLSEIKAEFGLYHVYSSDSFNENTPSSDDAQFLKNAGSSIYKSMVAVDPDAIWLMSGWMFCSDHFYWNATKIKGLLTSAEKGKIIVLDLQSDKYPQFEKFEMYYGQPFIWCMLHNFGGALGMYGDSLALNNDIYKARSNVNSTMVGTGLTPEGINQNYVMYDLMLESSLRNDPLDLDLWVENYTVRRYGGRDDNIIQAWKLLMGSVFNYTGLQKMRAKYTIISGRPNIENKAWAWYEGKDLFRAWKLFLNSSQSFQTSECYRHDLTDLTRQVLQYKVDQIYIGALGAFYKRELAELKKHTENLMRVFKYLDKILSSNKGFLLGNWLEAAKSAAKSSEDKKLFEYNARNQITLWGPTGQVADHASKQWAGIVSDYYAPRWQIYLTEMYNSIRDKKRFKKAVVLHKMFVTIERPFTFSVKKYPVHEIGDTVEIAENICQIWCDSDDYPKVPMNLSYHIMRFDHYTQPNHILYNNDFLFVYIFILVLIYIFIYLKLFDRLGLLHKIIKKN